jgi:hypothetical protein
MPPHPPTPLCHWYDSTQNIAGIFAYHFETYKILLCLFRREDLTAAWITRAWTNLISEKRSKGYPPPTTNECIFSYKLCMFDLSATPVRFRGEMRWKSHVGLWVASFAAVMERKQGQFMPPPLPQTPKTYHSNCSSIEQNNVFCGQDKKDFTRVAGCGKSQILPRVPVAVAQAQ